VSGSRPGAAGRARVAFVLALSALAATAATPLPAPPPPTPVEGTPSPFPTILRTPKSSFRPPHLRSDEAILEDLSTGQVLFRKLPAGERPIASLTKIMTALLALQRTDPDRKVTVTSAATAAGGSVLGLRVGERISVRNLLFGLLVQSSNDAAIALADAIGGTEQRFVRMMNAKARALHLHDTRFASASGLDDRGHSSPTDMVSLTRIAMGLPLFARIVGTRFHSIPAPSGPARRVENRNSLLWLYPGATGVKTGFTTAAGNCLVATAEREGRTLVAVVLGDPKEPFDDAAALLNYGFDAFTERTVLTRGQPVGTLKVEGRPVDVVAGDDLVRLVRTRDPTPVLRLIPMPGLRLPVSEGQPVGRVAASAGTRRVGAVPALAATAVDARGDAHGPGIGRQPLDDVLQVLTMLLRSTFGSFL
jgi:D-alanyl-D-alanine carboxypeptidase (penicillin-binding protein 5/6)